MKAHVLITKGILGDDHSRITKGIIYNEIEISPFPAKRGGKSKRHYISYKKEIEKIYDIIGVKECEVHKDINIYINKYMVSEDYVLKGIKSFDQFKDISLKGKRDIVNILFALGMLDK